MAGDCRRFAGDAIDVDAVTIAFPQELNAMTFEVADQIDPFMK